jgi:hypothetical protein
LRRIKLILVSTIFLLMLLGIPCYGATAHYDITNYTINADIQSDGGIDVSEFISYKFTGSTKVIVKDIDIINPDNKLYSAKDIDNIVVYEASLIEDDMTKYNLGVGTAGAKGIYSINKTLSGIKINIFSPAKNEIKRFVIQYHLTDAVVKYKDTADFYWNFIGNKRTTALNNVDIVVTIPATSSELKMFSHGPLSGNSSIVDKATVEYTNPQLKSDEGVSLRVLFSPEIIITKSKFINEIKLQYIINKEEKLIFEENIKKVLARISKVLTTMLPLPFLIILVLIFNYFKVPEKY